MKRIIAVFLFLVMMSAVSCKDANKKSDKDTKKKSEDSAKSDTGYNPADYEDIESEPVDAEEYYGEWGKVIDISDSESSDKMVSEKEAAKIYENLGFSADEVISGYTPEGEYYEETQIDSDSSDKHPMYNLLYTSENEILWNISIVGSCITADPVLINLENEIPVLYSVSSTITGYDSETNQFYTVETDEESFRVVTVDEVTKDVLDSITEEDF